MGSIEIFPKILDSFDKKTISWQRSKLTWGREDIGRGVEWTIDSHQHTAIVHLDGRMSHLRTHIPGTQDHKAPPLKGDIWIVPAGMPYHAQARGEAIGYAEFQFHAPYRIEAQHAIRDEFLFRSIERLCVLSKEQAPLALQLSESIAATIRLHLCQTYRKANSTKAILLSAKAQKLVIDYIESNIAQTLSLEILASLCGRGITTFTAEFKGTFGMTPGQFIIEKRLMLSQSLLRDTELPVGQIAMMSGFGSPSHLSSTFRAKVGCTPKRYRDSY